MNRLLFSLLWLAPAAVMAQNQPSKRIAYVIGVAHYEQSALDNSVNDARLMTAALQRLGFDVDEYEDCDRCKLLSAIRDFGKKLKAEPSATGLFYYSGHGVQAGGRNYLIPIDAAAQNEVGLETDAVNLDLLMQEFAEAKNAANIVILDACRTNPFWENPTSAAKIQAETKKTNDSVALKSASAGTLIAFSTAPECNAGDGTRGVGLYTQELIKALQTPAAPIETIFKKVRAQVRELSDGQQIPWENSSLETDFYFIPPAGALAPGVLRYADFGPDSLRPSFQYASLARKAKTGLPLLAPISLKPFKSIYQN